MEIAVPNLEIALAGEGTRIYSGAVELVSQQAEHLGRWIIDRYRQEGLDMVLIVYVTSEDGIAKLALRSNAGFTGSQCTVISGRPVDSIPLLKLAVREWV